MVDRDYHRDLSDGTVTPFEPRLVWRDEDWDGMWGAHDEAHRAAETFSTGWRQRYAEPPLWVVRIPGGFAIVPNSLYAPNMAWNDAIDWANSKELTCTPSNS